MEKLDLRKDLKYLYVPSVKKVEMVDMPPFNFIKVDGAIEPDQAPRRSSPRICRRSTERPIL